jgi:hypothetical protein
MGAASLASSAAGSFWREAALNAVSPVVAALLGGLVVSILIQQAQDRRASQTLRASLSTEMMKVAYGFYFKLIEVVRIEHYKMFDRKLQQRAPLDAGDLPQQYDDFRIAARVLEEQLRISFRDGAARWLWHGVVDMLTVRYYRLVHVHERFDDMIETHSQHPTDPEIPPRVQSQFMSLSQFQNEETVDAAVMDRFEIMLDEAIREVLRLKLDPPSGGAVLRPGRGSQLRAPAAAEDGQ